MSITTLSQTIEVTDVEDGAALDLIDITEGWP